MPSPVIALYHDDSTVAGGTPLDSGHPIDFGGVDKGIVSPTITIHVWNGKGDGSVGVAVAPKLYAISGVDDASKIFNGTIFNDHTPMLEARSCAAVNTAADQQRDWTPISPVGLLAMGNIPANAMRTVELRLNVPIDAPDMDLTSFSVRVSV
jgi:hypothetical protein